MKNEKGIALLYSLLLSVIIMAALAVGAQLIVTSLRESHKQKAIYAQGEAIAKAGIAESLSWFRRQQKQPIAVGYPVVGTYPDSAFHPRENTDTLEESVGLVGEIVLDEILSLWARYEVKRQNSDNYADPSLTDPDAVHDITGQKLQSYKTGQGLVWAIQSTGYVFVKRDPSKKHNEPPNEVVGRAIISTEFRRLTIKLPSVAAALYIDRGGPSGGKRLKVLNKAEVKGATGTYGVVRRGGQPADIGSAPKGYVSSEFNANTTSLILEPDRIFEVSADELKLMSDYLVSSVPKLPYSSSRDLPAIGIYYIDCPGNTAVFNNNYPLNTSGIIFVNGNLSIQSCNTGTYFTGVIYVNNGNVTINGPILISGALICNNKGLQYVTINGSTGSAEISYDPEIISLVRQQLTQYRENKSVYRVHSVLK